MYIQTRLYGTTLLLRTASVFLTAGQYAFPVLPPKCFKSYFLFFFFFFFCSSFSLCILSFLYLSHLRGRGRSNLLSNHSFYTSATITVLLQSNFAACICSTTCVVFMGGRGAIYSLNFFFYTYAAVTVLLQCNFAACVYSTAGLCHKSKHGLHVNTELFFSGLELTWSASRIVSLISVASTFFFPSECIHSHRKVNVSV